MERWANYNKGGISGWEPPMKVPWPPPRAGRRAFSLGFLESQASARHAGGVQTPYALGLVVVGDSAATGHSSLHGKATGFLHCCQQLLVELLIGLIGWDVNPVKAGEGQGARVTAGVAQSSVQLGGIWGPVSGWEEPY